MFVDRNEPAEGDDQPPAITVTFVGSSDDLDKDRKTDDGNNVILVDDGH